MRIVVCYICVSNGPITDDYVARFVTTYREYPPGAEHDTIVICNGGPLHTSTAMIFSGMKAIMFPRANDGGWDISAYQDAARGPCTTYDMMVCLGESVYFFREGWLKRLVETWEKLGPGMYSPFSSNAVRPHMNTTAFACSPRELSRYPLRVTDRLSRYQFEHGEQSFWRRVEKRGLPVRMVTWDGEYEPRLWRMPKNILWRGDQTNCLMWCNHSDGYANEKPDVKSVWARRADTAFR